MSLSIVLMLFGLPLPRSSGGVSSDAVSLLHIAGIEKHSYCREEREVGAKKFYQGTFYK